VGMTTYTDSWLSSARRFANKVPEVTLWFWIIKILCTTVGESFADYVNSTLGVGLVNTSVLFTAVLAVVLGVQLRLPRYVPFAYWLTVVVVSVTGTLYTDILTDELGVPLRVSTSVFAALLAGVFGVWYARERTLSIHSIVTLPREAFYWLAVLVTFALGTAAGDWTLELTGWGPGTSVLLPAGLIAVVVICWRGGAQPVLSFWLAYILTRPLGANLGDYLALPRDEKGLGLGTASTSVIFLAAILATVVYLTASKVDVIERRQASTDDRASDPGRERVMLVVLAVTALATGLLLRHTSLQPHTSALADEGGGSGSAAAPLDPAKATVFPAADLADLRTIAQDTLNRVQAGDQKEATARVKDLETTWDDAQNRLEPLDEQAWASMDAEIDAVLSAVRSTSPEPAAPAHALQTLLTSLGPTDGA
jgi:uncharacterized membrane-anchored protein